MAKLLRDTHSVVAFLLLVVTGACTPAESRVPASSSEVQHTLRSGLDELDQKLARMDSVLGSGATEPSARAAFRLARQSYKHVEGLLLYLVPVQASNINGPRAEDDDDAPIPISRAAPIGFQVIEAALFDGSLTRDSARKEVAHMRRVLNDLRSVTRNVAVDVPTLLDIAKQQLTRVAVLGLAGFDSDQSGDAIIEAAHSLDGLDALLALLPDTACDLSSTRSLVRNAAADLRGHPSAATYDRLHFIAAFAEPIGAHLSELQHQLGTPSPGPRRLWRVSAGTPFAHDAFDSMALAPAHARALSPELVALGERLFFDARLSGDGRRSCATCHVPTKAFTDGLARAHPMPGQTQRLRNTPTLINVAFEPGLFADGRARALETQIGIVLASKAEMASSVTALDVRQALAAYLRSLTAFNSRFDRAARGDTSALTPSERRGFTVFMGRGKCGTCHFAPLFNGVVPPTYQTSEAEVIGVPATRDLDAPTLDTDQGRAAQELVPNNMLAFKVPSLRNVALTAPYMHNGVFATLEQVVEFYDRGGGAGIGLHVPNQTLSSSRLHLTSKERRDLIAFMGTLTDTSALHRAISLHVAQR